MSNIRVDLSTPIFDGAEVVFRSPVDCSQVTGLIVYYAGGSQEFMFADAHGNNVGDIDHLFAENVAVKVILDVTTSMAFVQNADTNAYLEGRFAIIEGTIPPGIVCDAIGNPIVLTDSANHKLQGLNLYGKTTQNGTPTPDAPVALESAGKDGSVEVKVMGKNLFDGSVDYTSVYDGKCSWNNEALTVTGYIVYMKIPVKPNTTYSFSCESVRSGNTGGGIYIRAKDIDDKTISDLVDLSNTLNPAAKFTTPSNTASVNIMFYGSGLVEDETNYATFTKIQLEIGTTATEYEPYKEPQILTVPTPNSLPGIGEYRDEIDFTRGVYVQRIKELVLKGTESSEIAVGSYTIYPGDRLVNNSGLVMACCNCYPGFAWDDLWRIKENETTIGVATAGGNGIRFVDNVNLPGLDISAFRQFLKDRYAEGNPVIVQYVLAEPIETPLTAEQLEAYENANLHTHKPITTITCEADMKVEYVADTKAYIDNKFNELAAAIVNNI